MIDLSTEEMGLVIQLSQRWAAPDAVSIRLKHTLESKLLAAMEAEIIRQKGPPK